MAQKLKLSTRLDGQSFVVLGAGGGGIGTAIAIAITQMGGEVLCVDIDPAEADAVAQEVGGHAFAGDITKREVVNAIFVKAEELFGDRLRGIVDIVGMGLVRSLEDHDDTQYDLQFDVTLRHAFLAVQMGGPILARNGGGAIILIGSQAGSMVFGEVPVYGMAKAAMHHLVRYAATEFGPQNVRINAIAPGVVATPRLMNVLPEKQLQQMVANNPLRRACYPEDVARAIIFLLSELGEYINGVIVPLDGGASNLLAVADMGVDLPDIE